MSDIVERLLEPDRHDPQCPFKAHCYCDDGAPHDTVSHPLAREAADTITALRAEVERMRRTLGTIHAVIGNADHSKGHGPNAAEMRGNMLNDIRECARAALTQTKDTTDDD